MESSQHVIHVYRGFTTDRQNWAKHVYNTQISPRTCSQVNEMPKSQSKKTSHPSPYDITSSVTITAAFKYFKEHSCTMQEMRKADYQCTPNAR
eukprot:1143583-Pelagomonas_calceolata.AAC.2